MDQTSHKQLQLIEEHEGSILYTDPARSGVRTLGIITAFVFHDPATGQLQPGWHTSGYTLAAVEALAVALLANPGMKEALDGAYLWVQQRTLQASREKRG